MSRTNTSGPAVTAPPRFLVDAAGVTGAGLSASLPDGGHQALQCRVGGLPATVDQFLAGRFQAVTVAFAEPVQDVLAVQVALCFDLVSVQDLLDDLHSRGPEAARPVSEPGPGPQPVDVAMLRRDVVGQGRVLAFAAPQPRVLTDDVVPVEHRHLR